MEEGSVMEEEIFNQVFNRESGKLEVYSAINVLFVAQVLTRFNCNWLAYCQNETIKTFTLMDGKLGTSTWQLGSIFYV